MTVWNFICFTIHGHINLRPLNGFVSFLKGFMGWLFRCMMNVHEVYFLLFFVWTFALDWYWFLFNWSRILFHVNIFVSDLRSDWLLLVDIGLFLRFLMQAFGFNWLIDWLIVFGKFLLFLVMVRVFLRMDRFLGFWLFNWRGFWFFNRRNPTFWLLWYFWLEIYFLNCFMLPLLIRLSLLRLFFPPFLNLLNRLIEFRNNNWWLLYRVYFAVYRANSALVLIAILLTNL